MPLTHPRRRLLALVLLAIAWPVPPAAAAPGDLHILALTWQPAFCERMRRTAECVSQTGDRFDAVNLSLHGLWPQSGNYCGVDSRTRRLDRRPWDALPEPALSPETAARLAAVMLGAASNLHRHQWIKHGTCFGRDAETYFRISADLVDAASRLETAALLRERVGGTVRRSELCTALIRDFGHYVMNGTRIVTSARPGQAGQPARQMVQEIRLELVEQADGSLPLTPFTLSNRGNRLGCDGAEDQVLEVDAAGWTGSRD